MGAFDGEQAVVVGAGVAGSAAARVLVAEGATVRVSESSPERSGAAELRAEGIEVADGGHALEHLDGATIVVPSPGVPPRRDPDVGARTRLRVWGELELGARLARVPYLAVTGTNGKTTTTGLLAASFGPPVWTRWPAATSAGRSRQRPEHHDVLVVEASSFQLATQESFRPRVSVLLNLAPDHLDWHGSFEAYAAAKARIFARQGPGDVHVGNRDDEGAAAMSRSAPCEVRWFTTGEPSAQDAGVRDGRLVAGWSGADLGRVSIDTQCAPTRPRASRRRTRSASRTRRSRRRSRRSGPNLTAASRW